jgi:hypothetical protein
MGFAGGAQFFECSSAALGADELARNAQITTNNEQRLC